MNENSNKNLSIKGIVVVVSANFCGSFFVFVFITYTYLKVYTYNNIYVYVLRTVYAPECLCPYTFKMYRGPVVHRTDVRSQRHVILWS